MESREWLLQKLTEIFTNEDEVLIMMRGLPGIGKTTLARELGERFGHLSDLDISDDNRSIFREGDGEDAYDHKGWLYSKYKLGERIRLAREQGYKKIVLIGSGKMVKWHKECDYLFDLYVDEKIREQRLESKRPSLRRKALKKKTLPTPRRFEHKEHHQVDIG